MENQNSKSPQQQSSQQNSKAPSHTHKKLYKGKQYPKRDSQAPKWETETTSSEFVELTESKADLMTVLEAVNPDELLMTSLVEQSKKLKNLALKSPTTEHVTESEEEEISEEDPYSVSAEFPLVIETAKIKIDFSQTCPICDKPIREIMYALHDYEHDKLAHFDCVFKKIQEDNHDKLVGSRFLAYLGSGSFGIMDTTGQDKDKNKKTITLIEKIYPGAPLEELLHGDDPNKTDDEL